MAQQNSNRGKLLAVNTTALTIGRLGSKVLVFLLVRFYTAVLTKEEFGTADLITSLCNFLIPIACAGLSSGFFRFAAEARSKQEQSDVFSAGMAILLLASMGFALLSPVLFAVPYFSDYVWLILLYVLCANFHYLCSDFGRAQGNYRLFAIQGLLNTALNIGFNLIFLLPLDMGLTGYVLSIIAADLTTSLFLFLYCRLGQYLRPGAASRATVRAILRYSVPLIPAALCWWITNVSDRFMVTHICGEAQNGLYAAAYKIPNILTTACGIFIDAWQFSAVLANHKATDEETKEQTEERRRSLTAFFTKIFRGYGAFLLPLLMIYLAVVRLRDGEDYCRGGRGWMALCIIVLLPAMIHTCMIAAGGAQGALDTFGIKALYLLGVDKMGGGVFGGLLGKLSYVGLGVVGTLIVGIVLLVVLLMLFLGITPAQIKLWWCAWREARQERLDREAYEREQEEKEQRKREAAERKAQLKARREPEEDDAMLLPAPTRRRMEREQDMEEFPRSDCREGKAGRKPYDQDDDEQASYLDPIEALLAGGRKKKNESESDFLHTI